MADQSQLSHGLYFLTQRNTKLHVFHSFISEGVKAKQRQQAGQSPTGSRWKPQTDNRNKILWNIFSITDLLENNQ